MYVHESPRVVLLPLIMYQENVLLCAAVYNQKEQGGGQATVGEQQSTW